MAIRIKTNLYDFTKEMVKLENQAKEWNCTPAEAARELVTAFYLAAGFTEERIEAEFGILNDDQITECFCNNMTYIP